MKLKNNQSGFSLLEVLSSMTVFAIAAAGLASTTISTTKSNSTSRHTTVAIALIQDKIEELRSMDPTTNPADFAGGSHADASNPMTALGAAGGAYTRTWQVNLNTPAIGLSEVVVTVAWNSPDGPRSLSAVTFICRTASCS